MRLTSQTSLLNMSGDMFLQSAFQFGFYRRNLAWNSFYSVENLNLLVCRLNSPPIDQNFSSVLRRSIIIFSRTVPPCLCFYFSKSSGRNNAKYTFQYTFKNNTTRYAKNKRKKRKNKVVTFTTIFAGGYPSNS